MLVKEVSDEAERAWAAQRRSRSRSSLQQRLSSITSPAVRPSVSSREYIFHQRNPLPQKSRPPFTWCRANEAAFMVLLIYLFFRRNPLVSTVFWRFWLIVWDETCSWRSCLIFTALMMGVLAACTIMLRSLSDVVFLGHRLRWSRRAPSPSHLLRHFLTVVWDAPSSVAAAATDIPTFSPMMSRKTYLVMVMSHVHVGWQLPTLCDGLWSDLLSWAVCSWNLGWSTDTGSIIQTISDPCLP